MTNKEKKKAREHAYLLMYQWDLTKEHPEFIVKNYWEENFENENVKKMAESLFFNTLDALKTVDVEIERHLKKGWFLSRLLPMDRSILRVATWEILNPSYSPPPAVINDAVDIAKVYGEDEKSPPFINAILDNIYRSKLNVG